MFVEHSQVNSLSLRKAAHCTEVTHSELNLGFVSSTT